MLLTFKTPGEKVNCIQVIVSDTAALKMTFKCAFIMTFKNAGGTFNWSPVD